MVDLPHCTSDTCPSALSGKGRKGKEGKVKGKVKQGEVEREGRGKGRKGKGIMGGGGKGIKGRERQH